MNLNFKQWGEKLKQLLEKYKKLPKDEQIAWGAIAIGTLLIIVSLFLL